MIKFFSKNDLWKIHKAIIEILESVGIAIYNDKGLKLLEKNGASVEWKSKVVKIPESMLKEAIKNVPKSFNVYGRDGKKLNICDGRTYFGTCDAGFIQDIENPKSYKEPTKLDVENFVKVADYLNNVSFIPPIHISDVPFEVAELYEFELMLNNTSKPLHIHCYRGSESVKDLVELSSIILGSQEELSKKPIFMSAAGSASPLRFYSKAIELFIELSKRNIPVGVSGEPIAGISGPVTLAGTLALSMAQILAAIVLCQLVSKGSPVFAIGFSKTFDIKTGKPLSGSPEHALINAGTNQISRFYGIPSCTIMDSDTHIADAQSGYEKALTGLLALATGSNLIWGMGARNGIAVAFDQLLIDDEIVSMIKRVVKGIEVNEESLAVDIIKKVGIGGSYLIEAHTLKHFLKELTFIKIGTRALRGRWEKEGYKDMSTKAIEKVKEILKWYKPKPLDKDVKKALKEKIIQLEKKALSKA